MVVVFQLFQILCREEKGKGSEECMWSGPRGDQVLESCRPMEPTAARTQHGGLVREGARAVGQALERWGCRRDLQHMQLLRGRNGKLDCHRAPFRSEVTSRLCVFYHVTSTAELSLIRASY